MVDILPAENINVQSTPQELQTPTVQNKPVLKVGQTEVYVDIADDNAERAQGLSGRASLQPNEGMLFVYSVANIPNFWMKDMNFDLDMIWINDGKVVDFTENVPKPEPGTPLSELPLYSPSVPVDTILEVNAGFVQRNGIQVGDTVELPE